MILKEYIHIITTIGKVEITKAMKIVACSEITKERLKIYKFGFHEFHRADIDEDRIVTEFEESPQLFSSSSDPLPASTDKLRKSLAGVPNIETKQLSTERFLAEISRNCGRKLLNFNCKQFKKHESPITSENMSEPISFLESVCCDPSCFISSNKT